MLTIDPAGIKVAGFTAGVFDEKWTLEQDLAARATASTLAFAPGEQRLIVGRINVGPEEAAHFSGGLTCTKTKFRERFRRWEHALE